MASIPQGVRSVFHERSGVFAELVWPRFEVLLLAAVVCVGRHTAGLLLRMAGALADGHGPSDHRVLSYRRWSSCPQQYAGRNRAEYIAVCLPAFSWRRHIGAQIHDFADRRTLIVRVALLSGWKQGSPCEHGVRLVAEPVQERGAIRPI